MEIVKTENGLLLKSTDYFDLALTLDCGQAFRWHKKEDGQWHGIAFGHALTVSQSDEGILFWDITSAEFENLWRSYFDLDRDYSVLCDGFCSDSKLKTAVESYPGIRVLRQEPWEALCSFIISQNNNIPRIKGIIERLCTTLGRPLGAGDFAFPSAGCLAEMSVADLAPIGAGFRAKYILDAAQRVANGEVKLEGLALLPIEDARVELIKIKGVGEKVAECTLLYGCGRSEAFPVDIWVKRVMDEVYPEGLPECVMGSQGIAQQYLFHWRRQQSRVVSG